MKKPLIINKLETLASEITTYQHLQQRSFRGVHLSLEDEELKETMRQHALQNMGILRDLITEITGKEKLTVTKTSGQQFSYDLWFAGLSNRFDARANNALSRSLDLITTTTGKLEDDIKNSKRDPNTGERIGAISTKLDTSIKPKAFIVHGGRSGVLDKLREFVEALGIKPLVVEMLPSKGMTLADKVKKYQQEADCAIILVTRGGIIDVKSGKQHPRLNVIDELSSFWAAFPQKVVLLLEKGVELPSNKAGLTFEPFARQSMDRAFTAIARELTEMKILKAVKPQE